MGGKWQKRMSSLEEFLGQASPAVPIITIRALDLKYFPKGLNDGLYILRLDADAEEVMSIDEAETEWIYHPKDWQKEEGKSYEFLRVKLVKSREKEVKAEARLVRTPGRSNFGMAVENKTSTSATTTTTTGAPELEREDEEDGDRIVREDLTVHGTVHANIIHATEALIDGKITCLTVEQRSDMRYKKGLRRITHDLETLCTKHGYHYELFDRIIDHSATPGAAGKPKIGLIAQEWVKDFPELCSTDSDGGMMFDYQGVIAVHQEAIINLFSQLRDLDRLYHLLAEWMASLTIVKGYSHPMLVDGRSDDLARLLVKRLEEPENKLGNLKSMIEKVNNPDTILSWVEQCESLAREHNKSSEDKCKIRPGPRFFKFFKAWEKSHQRKMGRDPPVDLRDYQKEVVNKILQQKSSLLIMPTGTGKTAVAASVILNLSPPGEVDKCCLFIVQNSALVNQQQRQIRSMSPMNSKFIVSIACGGGYRMANDEIVNLNVTLNEMIRFSHVVVLTAGLLNNEMEKLSGEIVWDRIALVVLDETHNARGKAPFAKVLAHMQKLTNKPKVLGMTATPGAKSNSVEKAVDTIQILGQRLGMDFASVVISERDPRLQGHLSKPKVEKHYIQNRASDALEMIETLDKQVKELRDWVADQVRDLGLKAKDGNAGEGSEEEDLADYPNTTNDEIKGSLWKWSKKVWRRLNEYRRQKQKNLKENDMDNDELMGKSFVLCQLCEICLSARDLNVVDVSDLILEAIGECFCRKYSHEVRQILVDALDCTCTCSEQYNPRVQALLAELATQKELSSKEAGSSSSLFKAIVRVETRMTARKLHEFLHDRNGSGARLLLGRGQRVNDEKFTFSEMKANLDDFKHSPASNVLVSTSVVQEGIDVKACDLVICYDIQGSSSGADFIQLSGRARKCENSRFVVFLQGPSDEMGFEVALRQSQNQELALEEF